jgi:hypothetical protein
LGFEDTVTFSPPAVCENKGRLMRWPMLKPCVTEESAISVTLEMLPASGVPTKNDSPHATVVGADVIIGRDPRNR